MSAGRGVVNGFGNGGEDLAGQIRVDAVINAAGIMVPAIASYGEAGVWSACVLIVAVSDSCGKAL